MKSYAISSDIVLPISKNPLLNTAIIISEGKIIDIIPQKTVPKKYPSLKEISLGKGILMPGFVNAHTHLELGWIKQKIGPFKDFTGWLEHIIKAKKEDVEIEDIERSVKEGLYTLIKCGITTVAEISSYGETDQKLLKDSKIRSIVFKEILDSNASQLDMDTFKTPPSLQEIRPFLHAPYSCSPELIQNIMRMVIKKGIPISMHIAESPEEVEFVRGSPNLIEKKIYPLIGKEVFKRPKAITPFEYIKKCIDIDLCKLTCVHMVHVDKNEVKEIKEKEIGIVLCPRSNIYLKVGEPPINHYQQIERIGIGTDGLSSNSNLNFFEEMKSFYYTARKKGVKNPAQFTVYAATLGGAKALFIDHYTGSIDIGKKADLIFIEINDIYSTPYNSVIFSTEKDVKLSIVEGNLLKNEKGINV